MNVRDRSLIPTLSALVLALWIGAYVILQSIVLVETGGRETNHLVRTAWFVVLTVGIVLGIIGTIVE